MSDVFADTYYFVALVNRKGEEARRRALEATSRRTGQARYHVLGIDRVGEHAL